ncbi:hypothetical protein ACLQ2R_31525 [Streptosporangium sp. DT93]|uniref:hypothetical protein n=1 Tax=Streptosporangium sp. DT93 TaxID=3393428 RepID=UPI003CE72895
MRTDTGLRHVNRYRNGVVAVAPDKAPTVAGGKRKKKFGGTQVARKRDANV